MPRPLKKASILKIAGTLLVIGGIMLMLYPPFTNLYSHVEQARLDVQPLQVASSSPDIQEEVPALRKEPTAHITQPVQATPANTKVQPSMVPDTGRFALLEITSIKLTVNVLRGTTEVVLKKGPGWYEQSALPGEGNTAIAGHRTMYGGWFSNINQLKVGDLITLSYGDDRYTYEVEKVFAVNSNDWSVLDPCGYNVLTLTTCKKDDSLHRLVVRAKEVSVVKKDSK